MIDTNIVLKATHIDWDVDIDEAIEKLDEMTAENAAKALDISKDTYANMTTEERHDFAYDMWHHSPATLDEFVGVPEEVVIPDPLNPEWDEETISDYISEETGWCHNGFTIECNQIKDEIQSTVDGLNNLLKIID